MKSISRPLFTAIALLLSVYSLAQPEKLNNQWVPVGEVNDLTVHPNGESVLLAGEFDYLTIFKQYAVTVDSATYLPQNTLDFEAGVVNDVIPDGNGGWYVAGDFDQYDPGSPNGLFHLFSDFSIDPVFPNAHGVVNELKLDGTTLYVAGNFSNLGGIHRKGLGAINIQTMEIMDLEVNIHGEVNTIELFDNKLYLGGSFDAVNDYGNFGAQLNKATGDVNLYCDSPGPFSSIVSASAPDGNGGWFIGGVFFTVGDSIRYQLAHLNSEGRVTSWTADVVTPFSNSPITHLEVHEEFLYVLGEYTEIGGIDRDNAARVDINTGEVDDWNPKISGIPRCIEFMDESIFIAGWADMDRANHWVRNGGVINTATQELNNNSKDIHGSYVTHSVSDENGGFFISGVFSKIGEEAVNGFAHLDADGGLSSLEIDSQFSISPNAEIAFHNGILYVADSQEGILTFDSSGNYVDSGLPNLPTGITRLLIQNDKLIAIYSSGNPITIRIITLDNNQLLDFNPVIAKGPQNPGPVNIDTRFDAELIGDTLFFAGNFVQINGESFSDLVGIDINTEEIINYFPEIGGSTLELESNDNRLYVGGRSLSVGGMDAGNLAILDLENGVLLNSNELLDDLSLTEVTELSLIGNTLYAGLSTINQSQSYEPFTNYAIALNTENQELVVFDPGAYGDVHTISGNGSSLFIGGEIEHLGGDEIDNFAAYDLESGAFLEDQLVIGLGNIYSLAAYNDLLFAGGYAVSAGGQQKSFVAYNFQTEAEEVLYPSWGPAGIIYDMEIKDDVLYYGGGNFDNVEYHPVMGFDLTTYEFIDLDIEVYSIYDKIFDLEIDDSAIYVAHSPVGSGDQSTRYVSAWNTETGERIPNWGIEFYGGFINPTSNPVHTISLQGDDMYIGGISDLITNSLIENAASVDLGSGLPTSWAPEFNEEVHTLLAADGAMYVGGEFTSFSIGLQNYGEAYIAKLDTETAEPIWHLFDLFIDNTVLDLEYDPGQNWIYASGEFNMEDGSPTNYISAYSLDEDWRVTEWNPGPLEYPQKMTMHNGELWTYDRPGLIPMPPSYHARKVLNSGEFSEDSIPFFGSWLNAMAFQDDKIFMGGRFFGAGGIQRKNLAELDVESGLPTDFNPNLPLNEIQHVGISGSKVFTMGNTETDPELIVFDIETYELIPGFENDSPWPSSYFSNFELYNNNLFFNFGYGPLRRKSLLNGENLEVPSPIIFYDNRGFKGSSDYLYSWQQTLDWDLGMDVDTLVRTDLQNPEWQGLNVHADSSIHDMAELSDKIYFTGNFTEVNGLSREGLFRIDGGSGTLDDWSVSGLDYGEYSKIISSTHSLFRFVRDPLGGDEYELRHINPLTNEVSNWHIKQEPVDLVEAGNKLYVAGEILPEEVPFVEKFAVYDMNSCNTDINCQDATVYLDENGMGELDLMEVNLGADSDCTIQDIFLSNSTFSCDDIGVSSTSVIAITDDGLKGTCNLLVNVIDTIAPSLTIEDLELTIPEGGQLIIDPDSLDLVSSDNCSVSEIEVLGEAVFTCEDEGQNVPLLLSVTDYSGNQSLVNANIAILPSTICCEISAEFETNFTSACLGDTLILPLNLSGTYPFELTLTTLDQDTTSYVLESSDDSISVVIENPAFTSFSILTVSDANCVINGFSTFTISTNPSAGPDQLIELCATGEEVILDEYLSSDAAEDAIFTNEQTLNATVENSGTQLLVYESLQCGSDTAEYVFNFTEPGDASDIQVYCNSPIDFFYQVSFEIVDGNSPYSVNGVLLEENSFISNPQSIVESPEIEFLVVDESGCEFLVQIQVPDADGDGVCDEDEIVGCMNPNAANYNQEATDSGICLFPPSPAPITQTVLSPNDSGFGRPLNANSGEILSNKISFVVFPNPSRAANRFWINLNFALEELSVIRITDGLGRTIHQNKILLQPNKVDYQIDLDRNLISGIYIVSITSSIGTFSRRLIIQ